MEHSRPLLFQIRRIPGEEPLVRIASSSSPTLPPCDLCSGPSGPGAGSLTPTWETPAGTFFYAKFFCTLFRPGTPSAEMPACCCCWRDPCSSNDTLASPLRAISWPLSARRIPRSFSVDERSRANLSLSTSLCSNLRRVVETVPGEMEHLSSLLRIVVHIYFESIFTCLVKKTGLPIFPKFVYRTGYQYIKNHGSRSNTASKNIKWQKKSVWIFFRILSKAMSWKKLNLQPI